MAGVRKPIISELWHACAGPLVTLPQIGSLVYYLPQGHSEKIAVSTNRAANTQLSKSPLSVVVPSPQPKRHLLTTGWSMFIGAKRLRAGDAVLFIRDEKSQLLLGVRRANRQQKTLPSSVHFADSMHIGILTAGAHASANRSSFSIFYNPRACSSEFVIPLAKYRKALYGTQLSVCMRFGMMFETEESSKRRYMGTIVGISDLDPLRWPDSKWRSLQVEWDEQGCGYKPNRVSPWEVETAESLFIFPSITTI